MYTSILQTVDKSLGRYFFKNTLLDSYYSDNNNNIYCQIVKHTLKFDLVHLAH